MKMAVINEECEELTTFVSLVIREGCSFVSSFFGNEADDGYDDYIVCTTTSNFFIPLDRKD